MPGTGWTLKSYGFMMMVGFLSGAYLAMKRGTRVKCDPDVVLNCCLIALIVGVVGARVFYVVHYWEESFAFRPNPLWEALNVTEGGLEFLGGLIPAMIAVPLYLAYHKHSVRVYTDIMTVSTMWALGVARIGCFLNGCCFGHVCETEDRTPASVLAVQFPYASPAFWKQWENRQLTVPAELVYDAFGDGEQIRLMEATPLPREMLTISPEARLRPIREFETLRESYKAAAASAPEAEETRALAKTVELAKKKSDEHVLSLYALLDTLKFPSRQDPSRATTITEWRDLAAAHPARWVHPTQLYESAAAILLSIFLGRVFYRRRRHGMIFGLMMITYPLIRIPLEAIRADNPLDAFGLTASTAISLGLILAGGVYLFVLYRYLPERSPHAVAFVPTEMPQAG